MKITASQLRRIIKEEMSMFKTRGGGDDSQRFLHGFESGHPMDDEGYMVKSRMTDVAEMAETVCSLLDDEDQLPAWVQDLVASAHTDLEHVKDYLVGDERLRAHKGKAAGIGVKSESARRIRSLKEGHARITEEEFAAWKSGDWGFVSEVDMGLPGAGGKRRGMGGIPQDPAGLRDHILRAYEGHCLDLGCEDVSDPAFKEYVADQLAGQVDPSLLHSVLDSL